MIQRNPQDDGRDESPQSHGTFVYSQIVADGTQDRFGVIPKENVYVMKAVRQVGGELYFDMAYILQGWTTFAARMDSSAATTRVVNISAFGEPVPDLNHAPSVPSDGHLLIVAAAGNDHTENEPALMAFPRLSNGSSPLLIVGALNAEGNQATYSNWNPTYVQLFAPGDCVCGSPGSINGTSQAVPFVTTAAAVLAANHPDWNPRYVMWRLLSTADHPASLEGKVLGGTINFQRALEPHILLEEKASDSSTKVHRAEAIQYDQDWRGAFQAAQINHLDKETLRLYSPKPGDRPNQVCFTALQKLYFELVRLCVASDSEVTLMENGSAINLKAAQINDIVLPLPRIDDDGRNLPNVTASTAQ